MFQRTTNRVPLRAKGWEASQGNSSKDQVLLLLISPLSNQPWIQMREAMVSSRQLANLVLVKELLWHRVQTSIPSTNPLPPSLTDSWTFILKAQSLMVGFWHLDHNLGKRIIPKLVTIHTSRIILWTPQWLRRSIGKVALPLILYQNCFRLPIDPPSYWVQQIGLG